jgi:hypothetical protein
MGKKAKSDSADSLIRDLMRFIGRFVVMTDAQKMVVATYVIHTHLAKRCQQTPYIFIHSPEPECGKSRLMEVMELLVNKPWMIVNPSDAVLFRKVHADTPTLLWDEIDAVFSQKSAKYHEEQRGMLDQGHRRHGRVPRFVGDKVVEYDVYCPKVFAGIGTLPDTLSRRAIPISLKRRAPDEFIDEFILQDVEPEAEQMRALVRRWVDVHGKKAATTRPTHIPETISDRMKEGCFSLFAIADLLGEGEDFRKALEEILTGDRIDSAQTMRMRLLTDLRFVFAMEYRKRGKAVQFMSTDKLLERLYAFQESPWEGYYGRGLEAKDMADLLRPYDLHPRLVNVKGKRQRGYRRNPHKSEAGLADVWVRYLGVDETEVDPDAR